MSRMSPALLAPLFAALATCAFTINDATIKNLSTTYALHQLVFYRAVIGLAIVLLILAPMAGGYRVLRSKRPGLQIVRAACVFVANLSFFMGIVAIPLADAVAIFFITPFVITAMSVIFLGEVVGPRRWVALAVGFVGVLIVMRPGTDAFQPAAIYPVIAAFAYASLHILTRVMRTTETAVAMVFYIQLVFLVGSGLIGLVLSGGQFAGPEDPSLDFLLRAWAEIEPVHIWFFVLMGFCASGGGYMISQAYRMGEAAYVAPVEYLALPLSVVTGYLFFAEVPDGYTILGILLILGAGLFAIWREAIKGPVTIEDPTRRSH